MHMGRKDFLKQQSISLKIPTHYMHTIHDSVYTPPKTNMDTQNDGLENVSPFKYGHFWYPC